MFTMGVQDVRATILALPLRAAPSRDAQPPQQRQGRPRPGLRTRSQSHSHGHRCLWQKLVGMGWRAARGQLVSGGATAFPCPVPTKASLLWVGVVCFSGCSPGGWAARNIKGTWTRSVERDVTPRAEDRGLDITRRLGKEETAGNEGGSSGV